MKGKDIVKAVECCKDDAIFCVDCPYYDENGEHEQLCVYRLHKDFLDFINRLKAERNKYKIKAQYQKGELARLNKQVAEQKAEIKKLNDLFDSSQDNAFKALRLGLDLRKKIHRQRVELDKKDTEIDILIRKKESLNDEISELQHKIASCNSENAELKAENERLKAESDMADGYADALIEKAKIEAINEFLKRLEDESIESLVCLDFSEKELQNIVEFETAERIAKEMTEANL